MRQRFSRLSLLVGAAIIAGACSNTGGAASGGASASGSAAASVSASPAAPCKPAAAAAGAVNGADLKIGVVTDIGTVNDKNFNEYTFVGAKNGAAAVGAKEPSVFVPKDSSEYGKGLQAYIDQGFNIILTAGFNLGVATTNAACENPNIWFIGVDQGPPCVTETGRPDNTFACKGDAAKLLPRFIALSFQEDQAGYLAGMVAGTMTKSGTIGAIGGTSLCGPCIRYIQGYELGAKSIKSDVKVETAYVTNDFSAKAFNDPVTGTSFGQQFITTKKPDVIFQVAGKTGNGILDAACAANIYGIGVDVDQALSYPNAAKCTLTSAEKKLALAGETDIKAIVAGTAKGGDDHWDAKRDGIGYSPFHDTESKVPGDLKGKLDAALAAMKAGTLKTCPDNCGKLS